MENFPGTSFDLTRWIVSLAKHIGFGTLRALEVFISAIGAVIMLFVIGFFALWDFVFG